MLDGSLLSTTMTSADFSLCPRHQETSPGKSVFLLPIPAVSTGRSLLVAGLCEVVLTYPLLSASVYRFCSSVPEFAVSLPSVHASRQTTLRLTNRLHQLACERLSLSGIFDIFRYLAPMLGAHNMHKKWRGCFKVKCFQLT